MRKQKESKSHPKNVDEDEFRLGKSKSKKKKKDSDDEDEDSDAPKKKQTPPPPVVKKIVLNAEALATPAVIGIGQKDFITERWLTSISDFTNTSFNYVRKKEKTFYFEKKVGDKKHTKYFSIIN